jgi:hypothetical protein
MRLFGFLEPWEKFVAEGQEGILSPFFGDEWTERLMKYVPQSESATLEKVLQGFDDFVNSWRLIPGPAATTTLHALFDDPLMNNIWNGQPPPGPDTQGKCTTCGGSGKRTCAGCGGTGRITRMGRERLDINSCTVCYGSGRMRCDPCLGTGRRS